MTVLLSYSEAAERVRRHHRTIRRWRKGGMPMHWELRDGQRIRVVEEEVLLAWHRQALEADPANKWRRRARLAAQHAATM